MKNYTRLSSHGEPWLKAPRTGATCTLARVYSHTYINTVTTTTLCEAPAQLAQNLESIFLILKVPEVLRILL